MIDMSKLHSHADYQAVLSEFMSKIDSSKRWSIFKPVHLKVTSNKCPICECPLDGTISRATKKGSTILIPTIDHYRPKATGFYPNLKYDHENYILMCSDCNNDYKKCKFPLHSSTPNRNTTAITTRTITNESPLIANPIYDTPNDLFKIVFKISPSGKKVLELEPKQLNGYKKEKAEETIKLFSLGECENPTHKNPDENIQNCRIDLLHSHFNKFHSVVNILKGRDFTKISVDDQKKIFIEVRDKKLQEYGFYKSIMSNNYSSLVP